MLHFLLSMGLFGGRIEQSLVGSAYVSVVTVSRAGGGGGGAQAPWEVRLRKPHLESDRLGFFQDQLCPSPAVKMGIQQDLLCVVDVPMR